MKTDKTEFYWKCGCCHTSGLRREQLIAARNVGKMHVRATANTGHPLGHNVFLHMVRDGEDQRLGQIVY